MLGDRAIERTCSEKESIITADNNALRTNEAWDKISKRHLRIEHTGEINEGRVNTL